MSEPNPSDGPPAAYFAADGAALPSSSTPLRRRRSKLPPAELELSANPQTNGPAEQEQTAAAERETAARPQSPQAAETADADAPVLVLQDTGPEEDADAAALVLQDTGPEEEKAPPARKPVRRSSSQIAINITKNMGSGICEPFFDKLKYLLPVRLPKEVIIQNGRVSCLQILCQLAVVCAIFGSFFISAAYLQTSIPQMAPNGWREGHSTDEYLAGVTRDIRIANSSPPLKFLAHPKDQVVLFANSLSCFLLTKRDPLFGDGQTIRKHCKTRWMGWGWTNFRGGLLFAIRTWA